MVQILPDRGSKQFFLRAKPEFVQILGSLISVIPYVRKGKRYNKISTIQFSIASFCAGFSHQLTDKIKRFLHVLLLHPFINNGKKATRTIHLISRKMSFM